MLYKYSDFIKEDLIKEGSSSNNTPIYWSEKIEELLDVNWSDISTTRYVDDKYYINFKAGEGQYNYFSVIVENKGVNDVYYMDNSDKFINKFKTEFWKNASEYVQNFIYDPKCLGDLEHVKDSNKYNL